MQKKTERLTTSLLEKRYLDSLIYQEWDTDFNTWRFTTKQEFIYENDRIKTETVYTWNGAESELTPILKSEYTFDANGNLISEIQSIAGLTLDWTLHQKTDYTYFLNKDGVYKLLIEENFANYTVNPQWINTYKFELSYDEFETMVVQEIVYEWDAGENKWTNMYSDDYDYTSGLLSSIINSLWNNDDNKWEPYAKWDYFRDSFKINEEIQYWWDTDLTNDWVQESRFVYEYGIGLDAMPILTIETAFIWDTEKDYWQNYYKDEYQYDNHGNRSLGTYYEWIETPGEWAQYYKDAFIFDLNYSFSDLIAPFNYEEEIDDTSVYFNNMVIGYRGYEYVNQVWEDNMKMLFFYSDYTNVLSIDDEKLPKAIAVYPNPVKDKLCIQGVSKPSKVSIYNVLGKLVFSETTSSEVDLEGLQSGIYIVKIMDQQKETTRKFIKN
ncbi:T9SS type A sorting domain-containing protein [Polaribacter sp. SA4-10]|uniref:T9SS type A sorting domain-containing protein n=1 Tax=Polaribacter sp. SA4-10 TaxID=754397 RepID=UPI0012FC228D|nr:T9SS type A sorting domain-containing protein [Polaribacter sp. SA4-10]